MTKSGDKLGTYRKKRDFDRTREPAGAKVTDSDARRFVVQKHDASRLHYDFRLELDGVLLSWAVPKGPSLDPGTKRLAVHVEDHPLEYQDFEGTIPAEEYGGGTVMIWDRGEWVPEEDPHEGFRKGRLAFELRGQRLTGAWRLVRTSSADNQWLLIKRKDASASDEDVLERHTRSIASGRDLAGIARGRSDPSGLRGAREAPIFESLTPEKATLVRTVPSGDEWIHEAKFDGYRMLAFVEDGQARLVTRNGHDWTHKFTAVRSALEERMDREAVLDGEIVAFTPDGRTSFQALQNLLKDGRTRPTLAYCIFDVPYFDGYDLTRTPLIERKRLLERLLPSHEEEGVLRYSDHVRGEGEEFYQFACRSEYEGVVSKRADSPYRQERSRDWTKTKCLSRQEFVIGGYTEPRGSRSGFGALLLGVQNGSGLRYCGRVGTGFTNDALARIAAQLTKLERKSPPFANPPSDDDGVHWVRPVLVAEVEFKEWTDDGHLRHPSFQGLREDKKADEVVRESPKETAESLAPDKDSTEGPTPDNHENRGEGEPFALSNPDRVLWKNAGITKRDLAQYYEAVAERVLPHVAGRPLMLLRCPRGEGEDCFYQKHANESVPAPVRGVEIEEKRAPRRYIVIDDLEGLFALVQIGALELHPWGSLAEDPEHPDRMVFDLDPDEGLGLDHVVDAARRLRDVLEAFELRAFVRTTGGKGLHVVVPLQGKHDWATVKAFSRGIADQLTAADPDRYVATMSKKARKGKIFVDTFRNSRGATAIASYSTRARPGAPVATPLRWDELTRSLDPREFDLGRLPRRLAALKTEPWDDFEDVRQSITKQAMQALRGEERGAR